MMKIKKIALYSLYFKNYKRKEAKFQGLFHPAQANLGYFLAWIQSLQLPSTQSESTLALILLNPKPHASFKVCTQL
jgi:hypothetical protein